MKKIGTKLISSTLLFSILAYSALPVMAYTKEESVYSKLDSNGMVYQTTVSNHLKNTEKSELLKDISDLMNIENVSGDQEFSEENGKLIWKAEGEDIYYQGNSNKELPIECKITYKLNNSEMKLKEMKGKKYYEENIDYQLSYPIDIREVLITFSQTIKLTDEIPEIYLECGMDYKKMDICVKLERIKDEQYNERGVFAYGFNFYNSRFSNNIFF